MSRIISLALWLCLFSGELAANEYYVGVDHAQLRTDFAGVEAKPTALIIKAGAELYNRTYLEVQTDISQSEDELLGVSIDASSAQSALIRFRTPQFGSFSYDLAFGYAKTELNFTGNAEVYDGKEKFTGFAWGGRLNYELPYNLRLNADYLSRYNKDNLKIDTWSVGLSYYF
ncbi:outer membrane beta-barrel protein [Pseudoalteromonas sp. GB56]